jgi:RNA recognition motif-containing protein
MRAAVKCMRQGQQDSNPSANGTGSPPRQLCLSSLVENSPRNAAQTNNVVSSSKPSDAVQTDAESRTTVLLRRLPTGFTRSDLLEVLDSEGFKDCYDFVYMPVDFVKWSSFGYAFINVASHEEALRMWQHFDGFTAWPSHGDAKGRACEVAWSKPLQGLTALVERYRNSPVMHEEMPDDVKPVVFSSGQKVEFPAPTEEIVPVSRCRSLGQR